MSSLAAAAASCTTGFLVYSLQGLLFLSLVKGRFFLPCVQCTYYLEPACIFPARDSEFSQRGTIWHPNEAGVGYYFTICTYEESRACLLCSRCRSASLILDVHRSARSQAPTIMCTVHASHVVGRGNSSETCPSAGFGTVPVRIRCMSPQIPRLACISVFRGASRWKNGCPDGPKAGGKCLSNLTFLSLLPSYAVKCDKAAEERK